MAIIGAGDGEKQVSDTSSNSSNRDVITADQETAALGQVPFPNPVGEQPAPLVRLDSKKPKTTEEKEKEQEEEVDVSLRVDCATGQIFYRFYHGAVKTGTFAAETMYDYLTPLQQAIGQELSSIEDVEQLLGIKYSSSTGSSDKQRPLTAEQEESSAAIFMTYIVGRLRQSWSKPVEVKKVLSLFDDVRTIAEGSWEPSLAKHKSGGTQLSYAGYRRQYGKRNRQAGKSKCCTSLV